MERDKVWEIEKRTGVFIGVKGREVVEANASLGRWVVGASPWRDAESLKKEEGIHVWFFCEITWVRERVIESYLVVESYV